MPSNSEDQGCDILVVIAHPDDEVFTSGVICLCVDKGLSVKIVSITDGEGGDRRRIEDPSPQRLAEVRRKELDASARALGVSGVVRLHQADIADPEGPGGWDIGAVNGHLAALIGDEQPSVILTHGPLGGYGNQAHKVVHRCTMTVVEKTGFDGAVYSFCGQTPKAFFSWHLDQPSDIIFDVRDVFIRRCDSLTQHYSQKDFFLQPYFPETLRKHLSAFTGYTLSTLSFGRKRIPIASAERFFERFPTEGLVRQRPAALGPSDRLVELFLNDDRVQLVDQGNPTRGPAKNLGLWHDEHGEPLARDRGPKV